MTSLSEIVRQKQEQKKASQERALTQARAALDQFIVKMLEKKLSKAARASALQGETLFDLCEIHRHGSWWRPLKWQVLVENDWETNVRSAFARAMEIASVDKHQFDCHIYEQSSTVWVGEAFFLQPRTTYRYFVRVTIK